MLRNRNITVLGGAGFVGLHICSRLIRLGYRVRLITRSRTSHPDLLVLPDTEVIEGSVFDTDLLRRTFTGCSTVINLIGILNEKGHKGEGFRKIHAELPKTIMDVCRITGVQRLLHMSALNADAAAAPSHYLRSKGEGENTVHTFASESLRVTSFQPSVIFGEGDSFFNRFAGLLKITPVFFPLACPDARFAPVYVGDVADRFIAAIDDRTSWGKRIPLCGPEQYSLIELVRYTARQLGIRRWIIGLPDILSHFQAAIFEWVPGKPFSLDNYRSLQVDSVCVEPAHEPTTIESVTPVYIGQLGGENRFDLYRKHIHRYRQG